jgi:hypothetical protein
MVVRGGTAGREAGNRRMTLTPPRISIAITARPQSSTVARLLDALACQTVPPQEFEVLVALGDGDDHAAMRSKATPFRLKVVTSRPGRSAARNVAAWEASSPLLLFLADDLDPRATLIDAHLAAHAKVPGRILVGAYAPSPASSSVPAPYLAMAVRAQWHDVFTALRRRDHRYSFRDCLGGNLSISTELFDQLGGFREEFVGPRGDHELGARAILRGVAIEFVPEAAALRLHAAPTSARAAFAQARDEALGDALLGSLHPGLRVALRLSDVGAATTLFERLHHQLTFEFPRIADRFAGLVAGLLIVAERLQLRSRWYRIYEWLERHWYLRGLVTRFATREALDRFVSEGRAADRVAPPCVVDLRQGIDHAASEIDRVRPSSIHIVFDDTVVGDIGHVPGAEPLRGIHLRAALANDLVTPLFQVLTKAIAAAGPPTHCRRPSGRRWPPLGLGTLCGH